MIFLCWEKENVSERLTRTLRNVKRINGYVFCKEDGTSYGSIAKAFRMAVKRSGIRYCRFHDLRHTFATRLVMGGCRSGDCKGTVRTQVNKDDNEIRASEH